MIRILLLPLFLTMLLISCAESAAVRDRVEQGVDLIDHHGAPAYSALRTVCTASQWVIARDTAVADRGAQVLALRGKCHVVYELFEQVVVAKDITRKAVDASEEATVLLIKLERARQSLQSASLNLMALISEIAPEAIGLFQALSEDKNGELRSLRADIEKDEHDIDAFLAGAAS